MEFLALIPENFTIDDLEREYILFILRKNDGIRTYAAKKLGISLRNLRQKLTNWKANGIEVPESKKARPRGIIRKKPLAENDKRKWRYAWRDYDD